MVKAKKYVVLNPFVGEPKLSDFTIVEEELPALQEDGKSTIFIKKRLSKRITIRKFHFLLFNFIFIFYYLIKYLL